MARRRQAVSIRHVGTDAGVLLQTVSRVINKEQNVRPQRSSTAPPRFDSNRDAKSGNATRS